VSGLIHAWMMGNFYGEDDAPSKPRHGDEYKATDARYSQVNRCCYPGCNEWIRNDAHTCLPHRGWYQQRILYPAKRLHSVLTLLEDLPGDSVAVTQADLLRIIQLAEAGRWAQMYAHLSGSLERSL